jgi:hypothetical protein
MIERVARAISNGAYDALRVQGFSGGWDHDEFGRAIARAAIAAIPPPIPDRFDARDFLAAYYEHPLVNSPSMAAEVRREDWRAGSSGAELAFLETLTAAHQAGIEEGLERAAGAAHPGNNENWDVATARSIQFAIRSLSHRREGVGK